MISINLLPFEKRPRQLALNRIMALFFLVSFLICGGLLAQVFFQQQYLYEELEKEKAKALFLQPDKVKMKQMELLQQEVQKNEVVLRQIEKDKQSWHSLLLFLGTATPPNLWLTEITAENKTSIIRGVTINYPLIIEFMEHLKNQQFFMGVHLTSAKKDAKTNLIHFELVTAEKGSE